MSHSTESQTLGDWITACDDFLALPRTVMQDVGPAAQTLGAVYALTGGDRGGQMRESLDTIRQVAVLPRRTVQTHIPKLVEAGWVESLGRGLLPRSAHRRYRTVTLKLTRQAVDMKEPFWMLPRWAATRLHTWSERALFAYLCSACKLVETIELGGEGCAEGREFRKPTIIATDTGLSLPSIRAARDKLRRAHLINAYEGDWSRGEATELAVNTAYILKRSDVAKPVTRKPRARQGAARTTRQLPDEHQTTKPALCPEKSCADPMKKPAPTPEQTCAIPPQKPAHTPEKTCAPHGREPMDKTIGKNLGNKPPGKNSWSEHACRRATDHLHLVVDFARDGGIAKHALQAMGYTGDDGALVWQAACWFRAGILTEAQFGSAYNGVRVRAPKNPIAYFRTILAETLGNARLAFLIEHTEIPDGILDAAPAARAKMSGDFADEAQRDAPPVPMRDVLQEYVAPLQAQERSP